MLRQELGAQEQGMGKREGLTAAGTPQDTGQDVHYRLGSVVLHEQRRELFVAGQRVELQAKPFDLLLMLLQRPGQLLTKEQLFETLWAGRIVTESVLTRCVAKLRQTLGDEQACIETVHGYGYRLLGEVQRAESAPAPSLEAPAVPVLGEAPIAPLPLAAPIPARKPWGLILAAAAACAMLALFLLLRGPARDPSIAVLPFADLSPQPADSRYLTEGIQENILTQLASVAGLKVISRTSTQRYSDGKTAVGEIGRALGVAHVLEGSVQRVNGSVRVHAQLIDAATDEHLWAASYDRPLNDLFSLQSDIAEQVALAVGARLTEDQRGELRRSPTADSDAYQAYLRAREYERSDGTSQENLLRAQALLERAVTEDPDFALAHAVLSRVHTFLYWFAYDPAPERRDRAKASADRALQLNPRLAEGHLALGLYRAAGFRDYRGAAQAYQRALELQPSAAVIQQYLGTALRRQSDWSGAQTALEQALALDPVNPIILYDLAELYRGLRNYERAAALYARIEALQPDTSLRLAHAFFQFDWKGDFTPLRRLLASLPEDDPQALYPRYLLALWQGDFAQARERLRALPTEWLPTSGGTGRLPKALSLGVVAHFAGDSAAAREQFERSLVLLTAERVGRPDSAAELAGLSEVQAGLGQRDAALASIRRALDLMPASLDPIAHGEISFYAAMTYSLLGETDLALDQWERLLTTPFGASVHALRQMPYWAPLRANPRYAKLVEQPERYAQPLPLMQSAAQ